MANLMALIAGLIFGVGLIVGGMTNPAKVLAFLDVTGDWDPSLAFVMMGAIAVGFFAFKSAARHSASVLGLPVQLPGTRLIDRKLVLGAVIFGTGWGIAGFCPGPAIASLLTGGPAVWLFVASMLAGMAVHTLAVRRGWL
ncbi:DUF6691 family protein [Methylophilus sp. VKM B-3414]|uniref:DUF6691 family protein n=1 Tax=unclassified Methylophilus TaxID=2630143 RepID=UPI0028CAE89B|nr:DUF6691 family protein [Methylophilus sp. VKM B-3414]MDT7848796.1 DUF6691 family protein [Methylophilus sp. VKM B-3414]BEV09252.1 YeeE/YedE family protein [Methylophilus sp. DW102]